MERHGKAATAEASMARCGDRGFRRRLALTTVLTVAPFLGYGRQAFADCALTGPSTYTCSGASAEQDIIADNANVTTVAGFSVNTDTGTAIEITGEGQLAFTDINASSLTSTDASGLFVQSTGDDGETVGEVTIRTNGTITGSRTGIDAQNYGSGNLSITADGTVTGENLDGIYARNLGNDLTITTGVDSVITGAEVGITATNAGSGNLGITVKGVVAAQYGEGIAAINIGNDLRITTEAGSVVTGVGYDGIYARNDGGGELDITVNGEVTGGSDGLRAYNRGTNLKINTGAGSVITGASDGIEARNYGDGEFAITVKGRVTGYGDDGIESDNYGPGRTKIDIRGSGIAEGNDSAIDAYSKFGQDISITNYGVVRNLSGNSADLAIETNGGGNTEIENKGDLIGTVDLGTFDDNLDNAGFWNTARGENDFGGGDDEVVNSGTLLAADDASEGEETYLSGLEAFDNDGGLISLVDGAVGDTLRLIGEGPGAVAYSATDGRLAVDAVLGAGPDGQSDVLFIGGDVTGGVTRISVNVLDALRANTAGIPVVQIMDGSTGEGDFQLDGPLYAGFYTWDMRYDDIENVHELFTSGVGVGAYEFAAGITAAQDMWFQSTGVLLQRQADLRPLIAGMQVTPVADFAQPVEATPVAKVMPGFWMRGVGAWLERDDEQDGFTLDRKQTIYGGLAGFDFGKENVGGQGGALMFGLFGGYLVSDLDFTETNSEWSYEGPSLGVYASYLNGAFYADATVKADFLDISIDPEDLASAADDSDTDGLNIGAMVDAGYKFGAGGGVFVEPQATLALLHTAIDDVDVFGGTVEFDDETSVRGRLGLRLGYDHTASNAVVYSSDVTASVWQNFSGENGATIADPLLPAFAVADDPAQTYGDVSVGFSAAAQEGWSGFLRANYQFADDYEAIAGNAGVRFAW